VTAGTGDQFNVNPLLSAYQVGSMGYRALLSGSPAIDAGNPATCLPMDQRGVSRPQGATCDIGAYEYTTPGVAASFGIVNGSNQRAAPNTAFKNLLSVYVIDSLGSPVSGVLITFTAPTSGASGTFTSSGTNVTTATTNDSGIVIASTLTANNQQGSYNVTATASDLAGTATFALTNVLWYVSPSGNDSNNCATAGTPCLTINGGIGKAIEGDTINVAVGTYTSTLDQVVWIDKDITLSGGWNAGFATQSGTSTIDGQVSRAGIIVDASVRSVIVVIEHFTIQNGITSKRGGGIRNASGTLTLSNSSVINNVAPEGGGISNEGGMNIKNSIVSGNTTNVGGGGGIMNQGALMINNSTVSNNTSFDSVGGGVNNPNGGGISNVFVGTILFLNNSTVSGNTSTCVYGFCGGGGIYLGDFTAATLNNSTVSGNTVTLNGGGIFNSYSTLNLNSSTISNNNAGAGGGVSNGEPLFGVSGGTLMIRNTIIVSNTVWSASPDCRYVISTAGYNLIGNNSGCTFSASTGDLVGTSASPINPRLTPLQNNGGPTLTHALLSGSPAINAGNPSGCTDNLGNPLNTDQRGASRVGRCDIGAFEYGGIIIGPYRIFLPFIKK
jgi:hypothetical protein